MKPAKDLFLQTFNSTIHPSKSQKLQPAKFNKAHFVLVSHLFFLLPKLSAKSVGFESANLQTETCETNTRTLVSFSSDDFQRESLFKAYI